MKKVFTLIGACFIFYFFVLNDIFFIVKPQKYMAEKELQEMGIDPKKYHKTKAEIVFVNEIYGSRTQPNKVLFGVEYQYKKALSCKAYNVIIIPYLTIIGTTKKEGDVIDIIYDTTKSCNDRINAIYLPTKEDIREIKIIKSIKSVVLMIFILFVCIGTLKKRVKRKDKTITYYE